MWTKYNSCQGVTSTKGTHLTINSRVCVKVDRLPPSSFTYVINLSNKLYDEKTLDLCCHCNSNCIISFKKFAMHTHYELMKFITRTNVSHLNFNIHKSIKIVVTQESKVGITYISIVLAINERMACLTMCF